MALIHTRLVKLYNFFPVDVAGLHNIKFNNLIYNTKFSHILYRWIICTNCTLISNKSTPTMNRNEQLSLN